MATDEAREFLERTQQNRGYTLEMHRIMAEVDLEWAEKYNQFIEATYTGQRLLDRKTKELLQIVVEAALRATGSTMMTEPDAKAVLAAYGIPIVETLVAKTPAEAADKAGDIGFPVALKILSSDISHKSDVGGVQLFLETPEAVKAAAEAMLDSIPAREPNARLEGFTVQRMAERPAGPGSPEATLKPGYARSALEPVPCSGAEARSPYRRSPRRRFPLGRKE